MSRDPRTGRGTSGGFGRGFGVVLPSWLVALSAVLVVLAVVGFAVSGDREPEVAAADDASGREQLSEPGSGRGGPGESGGRDGHAAGDHGGAHSTADAGAHGAGHSSGGPDAKPDPAQRRTAYVEVYNNSGITGLAAETTAVLQDTGWRVVVTDNWYGEIPSNTVYHPGGMRGQAELLASDLGIDRVQGAVDPMSADRLTVILTGMP